MKFINENQLNANNSNSNYLYNKAQEKDSYQYQNKISTLNKQNLNKQNQENNNLSLKYESPYRNKNDIIDRIINENKGKFYEFDMLSNEKTNLFNKDARFKVNEKDFEFFDNSEKKNVSNVRKKYNYDENNDKKGDFESRRRNKINEITEKDDYDSYDKNRSVINDYKKTSGNNNNLNVNNNKKENNSHRFQKY